MVKLDDDIEGGFPDLTFFIVNGQWNEKFKPKAKITILNRIFCTLENSLSIRSVLPFLVPKSDNPDHLFSIKLWKQEINNRLEFEMNVTGMAFAETGKVYREDDFKELRRDYFVAKLSGLKQ